MKTILKYLAGGLLALNPLSAQAADLAIKAVPVTPAAALDN